MTTFISYDDVCEQAAEERSNKKIRKFYEQKNFKEAFSWMCRIAFIAEEINHHPNWTNVFKTVDISLSTHDAGGLTELDLDFANAVEMEA